MTVEEKEKNWKDMGKEERRNEESIWRKEKREEK